MIEAHAPNTQEELLNFERKYSLDDFCKGSTYDLIRRAAKRFPKNVALKYLPTSDQDDVSVDVTYESLIGKINQAANLFHQYLSGSSGVVSYLLPNIIQNHIVLWGAEAAGVAGPVNYYLNAEAIRDILIASETEVLVALGPTSNFDVWEKVVSIADQVPSLKVIFITALNDNTPPLSSPCLPSAIGDIRVRNFDAELDCVCNKELEFRRNVKGDDIASVFHTGGTTGLPKVAQHSHSNQVYMASVISHMFNLHEHTVAFVGLPMFHVNAVFLTGLNVFINGGCIVLLTAEGFRGKDVVTNLWSLVHRHQASYISVVPTIVTALLNLPTGEADTSSLDFVACGAAPLSSKVHQQFEQKTGIPLCEGYGLTEATAACSGNPVWGKRKAGSIGLRFPFQEMKVVNLDINGDYLGDRKTNEIGALVVRGPNVFQGYKQTEKNTEVFHGDGWLLTGDLGRQDEDGYFYITGRLKDLIIRGGHNIDPQAIEEAMLRHPSVALVAAIGQPDAYAGELPCVYLTLQPGAEACVDELKSHAQAVIGERASIPVYFEVLNQMPLTAVGKIFKPALRERAIARVVHAAVIEGGVSASVEVENCPSAGTKVIVRTSENHEVIQNILEGFPIGTEIQSC